MANGFMGKEGQTVPEMSDEWISTISGRYIELYEKLIGEPFSPAEISEQETYDKVVAALDTLP
jgi:phosphoribosylaminoimidazole-succinocarboxamide synthase